MKIRKKTIIKTTIKKSKYTLTTFFMETGLIYVMYYGPTGGHMCAIESFKEYHQAIVKISDGCSPEDALGQPEQIARNTIIGEQKLLVQFMNPPGIYADNGLIYVTYFPSFSGRIWAAESFQDYIQTSADIMRGCSPEDVLRQPEQIAKNTIIGEKKLLGLYRNTPGIYPKNGLIYVTYSPSVPGHIWMIESIQDYIQASTDIMRGCSPEDAFCKFP